MLLLLAGRIHTMVRRTPKERLSSSRQGLGLLVDWNRLEGSLQLSRRINRVRGWVDSWSRRIYRFRGWGSNSSWRGLLQCRIGSSTTRFRESISTWKGLMDRIGKNSWSRLRKNRGLGLSSYSSWNRLLLCRRSSCTYLSRWVGSQSWNVLVEAVEQLLGQVTHLHKGAEVWDGGTMVTRNGMGHTLGGGIHLRH